MDIIISKSTLKGTINPPSCKSMTHRAFILSGLSSGRTEVDNYLEGEDTMATLRALQEFGAKYSSDGSKVIFEEGIQNNAENINCRNSGTTLRLLSGVATLFNEDTILTGDKSLQSRPMDDLVMALKKLGASISDEDGKPPIKVRGPLSSTEVSIPGQISSQYISSLLIRLSIGEETGKIRIIKPIVSKPYILQTIEMLSERGIKIVREDNEESLDLIITPLSKLKPRNIKIPLDFSSAAFFIVAGTIGNNSIDVIGCTSKYSQADQRIIEIINAHHGNITTGRMGESCVIQVKGSTNMDATEINVSQSPDIFPILCLLATQVKGSTKLFGARQLKSTETP